MVKANEPSEVRIAGKTIKTNASEFPPPPGIAQKAQVRIIPMWRNDSPRLELLDFGLAEQSESPACGIGDLRRLQEVRCSRTPAATIA